MEIYGVASPGGMTEGDVLFRLESVSTWWWRGTRFTDDHSGLRSAAHLMTDEAVWGAHETVVSTNIRLLAAQLVF